MLLLSNTENERLLIFYFRKEYTAVQNICHRIEKKDTN